MYLESLPKKLNQFAEFWGTREIYVSVLESVDLNSNVVYYYNNEQFKNKGYYTIDSYEPNVDLNFILAKEPASWKIKTRGIRVIDFDSSGEIGSYLFSLFEYFSIHKIAFKEAKQRYKSNPNCLNVKHEYDEFKKDLLEIRNVLNTHSKFNPNFDQIRNYCMYLINIGVTSDDFKKKDLRTVL